MCSIPAKRGDAETSHWNFFWILMKIVSSRISCSKETQKPQKKELAKPTDTPMSTPNKTNQDKTHNSMGHNPSNDGSKDNE